MGQEAQGAQPLTVHIILPGRVAACGFYDGATADRWPAGHQWVSISTVNELPHGFDLCRACRDELRKTEYQHD